jgi:hypothetical protein
VAKKKAAGKKRPATKKGSGARSGSRNLVRLKNAGLLSVELLSPKAKRAIQRLPKEDVDALLRINKQVSLSAFFKARPPQEM